MAGTEATGNEAQTAEGAVEGVLVFAGSTDWDTGKGDASKAKKKGGKATAGAAKAASGVASADLLEPHRLHALQGVKIASVAAGCVAAHCVALSASGDVFIWGRNQFGQLGLGDTDDKLWPHKLAALQGKHIVGAAVGRHHTICVAADGSCYSWGSNKHGQLATGSIKHEMETRPVQCAVKEVKSAACGADFTLFITAASSTSSNLLSAGLPQFGQLGHGTDHEYNAKEGTVKLMYEPQPTPRAIAALKGMEITKAACGTNHSVVADSNGFVYTWGFGGHGRLGHREQKDEWVPRRVDIFARTNILPPTAVVAAGSAFSACTAGGGQLYMWGRVKMTGDNWMYPKPLMEISGWNIRSMDSGNTTSCVAAESSAISWGTATHGELGYGPKGQKSSAQPKKIDSLEGLHTSSVACGSCCTLLVVGHDGSAAKEAIFNKIPIFKHPLEATEAAGSKEAKGGKGAKGKAKEVVEGSEEDGEDGGEAEEEEEEEEEEVEEEEEKSKGRKRGAAKGRGAAAAAKKTKTAAGAKGGAIGRGRGRGAAKGAKRGKK